MKLKILIGLALIVGFSVIILLLDKPEKIGLQDSSQASDINERQLMELVQLENEAAKGEDLTTTKHTPDYTEMFPDLYTEYLVPMTPSKEKKVAYLTFDDGPSKNTFEVLDILKEHDIKATFFIVGSAINDEGEDSLKRMMYEGHVIGIHTYSHMCNKIYCSIERFLDDFNTVYQQIYDITGERVNIFRFPWGSNNKYNTKIKDALIDEMERRGFSCYDWNVSADDSIGNPTSSSILRNIKKDLKRQNNPIILMHDSKINDLTVEMLPDIIKMISDMGYEFDTLDHREPYVFPW